MLDLCLVLVLQTHRLEPPRHSSSMVAAFVVASAQEHSLIAKSMEVVPSGELQEQFARYSDEAIIRLLAASRNGRVRFVMVPVDFRV